MQLVPQRDGGLDLGGDAASELGCQLGHQHGGTGHGSVRDAETDGGWTSLMTRLAGRVSQDGRAVIMTGPAGIRGSR